MLRRVLKVGDKVRVIKNLNISMEFNGLWITSSMLELKDKIVTIKCIREKNGQPLYRLEEGSPYVSWTQEMLEEIVEKPITIRLAFNGTATIAKVENKQGIALCNPKVDLYDENEGIRIAICRALDIDPFKVEKPVIKTLEDYSIDEILEELANKVN